MTHFSCNDDAPLLTFVDFSLRFPDATPEELQAGDRTCIVCREDMEHGAKKSVMGERNEKCLTCYDAHMFVVSCASGSLVSISFISAAFEHGSSDRLLALPAALRSPSTLPSPPPPQVPLLLLLMLMVLNQLHLSIMLSRFLPCLQA